MRQPDGTSAVPTSADGTARALEEYLAAAEAGQAPPRDEFLARHPHLADDLDACLAALRFIGRAAPEAAGPDTADSTCSRATVVFAPPPQLGRFRVVRELGRGGFGVVYLATDPLLHRPVAVKVPRPEALFTPALRRRFLREARAAAALSHPNLVPVFDSGEVGALCYLVSAYCPGGTLAAYLRRRTRPLPVRAAAAVVAVLADAVQQAHARGILHRDIKPSNVLLDCAPDAVPGDGSLGAVLRLADFGLAKFLEEEESDLGRGPDTGMNRPAAPALTGTGAVLGTPEYMAPEQAAGSTDLVGPATDVHALGVLLYELLTGRPPFRGDDRAAVLRQVAGAVPPGPRSLRRGVARDLDAICLKCLAKGPHQRYATAGELADDLRRFLNGQATRARPLTVWQRGGKGLRRRPGLALAVSAGLLALVALVGVGWYAAGVQDSAAALSADADTARHERDRVEAEANTARQRLYAREIALLAESAEEGRLTTSQLPSPGPEELRGFEWYYLRRLARTDQAGTEWFVGRGHTQLVSSVAFSPDGQLCASASHDGTILVWDLAKRELCRRLTGHTLPVNTLAFSPDGKTLASGASLPPYPSRAELKLWDVATGREEHLTAPGNRLIENLAFSPDGQTLATCGHAGNGNALAVLLWDLRSGDCRGLQGLDSTGYLPALAFSPDGKMLAVGCGVPDGSVDRVVAKWAGVQLFDLAAGTRTAVLTGQPGVVDYVAFTPDGKTLVSGDMLQTVKVWDLASRQERVSCRVGAHVALSPGGHTLAAAAGEPGRVGAVLQLYDVATGRCVARVGTVPAPVGALRFGPSGTQLAVGLEDGTVRLFDARNIHDLPAHRPAEAWAVAFAPDGKTLASAGDDHTIRLWSVPAYKQQAVLHGHTSLVASVAFSPDGRTLASGGFDHAVRLWDVAAGREKAVLRGHAQSIRMVAFSPDGRVLATAAKSLKQPAGKLKLWDLPAGKERTALAADGTCLAFSPDGKRLAFRDPQNAVRLLHLATRKPTHGLAENVPVNCLAFAPDGETLTTGDEEGRVKQWDAVTGAERRGVRSWAGSAVRALAYAPDGKTVASAGIDKTIVLWQVATGLELCRFKGLPDYGLGLAFSPDGTILAAALHDGTIRLYQSGRER